MFRLQAIEPMEKLCQLKWLCYYKRRYRTTANPAWTCAVEHLTAMFLAFFVILQSPLLFAFQYGVGSQSPGNQYPNHSLFSPRASGVQKLDGSIGIQNERQMRVQATPASTTIPNVGPIRLGVAEGDDLLGGSGAGN
jgi:hypothetical protein